MGPPATRASALPTAAPLPGVGVLCGLLTWALGVQPELDGPAIGGATNTTFSTSSTTSSETVTTTETVRADTFATRLVVTNPVGIVVSDQALPAPFADASVQQAIDAAEAALLAGPPASLVVKGRLS